MGETMARQTRCPYCNELFQDWGVMAHIYRTGDNLHGDINTIPDDFDKSEVEVLGGSWHPKKNMTRSSNTSAENHLYLCNWCNEIFDGERGYNIHLSKVKGDSMHPEGASIEHEQYTLIPADEDFNPLMDIDDIYEVQKRRRDRGDISFK